MDPFVPFFVDPLWAVGGVFFLERLYDTTRIASSKGAFQQQQQYCGFEFQSWLDTVYVYMLYLCMYGMDGGMENSSLLDLPSPTVLTAVPSQSFDRYL